MEEVKSIFKSKTFWFNLAVAALGISATIGTDELTNLGITGLAQKWALVGLGGITTIGNIYLRSITSLPVTTIKKKN